MRIAVMGINYLSSEEPFLNQLCLLWAFPTIYVFLELLCKHKASFKQRKVLPSVKIYFCKLGLRSHITESSKAYGAVSLGPEWYPRCSTHLSWLCFLKLHANDHHFSTSCFSLCAYREAWGYAPRPPTYLSIP